MVCDAVEMILITVYMVLDQLYTNFPVDTCALGMGLATYMSLCLALCKCQMVVNPNQWLGAVDNLEEHPLWHCDVCTSVGTQPGILGAGHGLLGSITTTAYRLRILCGTTGGNSAKPGSC